MFGPFQVVVTYGDDEIDTVLDILDRMSHHLTAAVVSADVTFQDRILGATVNDTSYCGMRAGTTGAPEAIHHTWSGHREIIMDQGPLPENWSTPESA